MNESREKRPGLNSALTKAGQRSLASLAQTEVEPDTARK